MIRRLLIILFAAATAGVLVLRAQSPAAVDFRADVMSSLKVGDSTALLLVGHVVFHHNGAVDVYKRQRTASCTSTGSLSNRR